MSQAHLLSQDFVLCKVDVDLLKHLLLSIILLMEEMNVCLVQDPTSGRVMDTETFCTNKNNVCQNLLMPMLHDILDNYLHDALQDIDHLGFVH